MQVISDLTPTISRECNYGAAKLSMTSTLLRGRPQALLDGARDISGWPTLAGGQRKAAEPI